MRASLRALSFAALVSSATSAVAAPSLWDGGLLPEESSGPTVISNALIPHDKTDNRDLTPLADLVSLWDGGLLPELPRAVTFASGSADVSLTAHEIDESYVSLADAELLASITASIERELRAFVFLHDHEGDASAPIGYSPNHAVWTDADPDWNALDQLPSPVDLAGLVLSDRSFLVEDEDDLLPDAYTVSLAVVEGEQAHLVLHGYKDH
jgi:hypothetical protein